MSDITDFAKKVLTIDNGVKSSPEYSNYVTPLIDKINSNTSSGIDSIFGNISNYFNFCIGDFTGSELATDESSKDMTCDIITYEKNSTIGILAIKIGQLPCGTGRVDIKVCISFTKSGTFGLSFSGGLLTCAAAATGIGELVAPFVEVIDSVGFAISIENLITQDFEISLYEENDFNTKTVTLKGNLYFTLNLSLSDILFGDQKFGKPGSEKKLSDILEIKGSVKILLDILGESQSSQNGEIANARTATRSNHMDIIKRLLNSKAEFGINVNASTSLKLNSLTNGFLPDFDLGSIDFTIVATLGGGRSKLDRGIYIRLTAKISVLTTLYKGFKNTIGKIFEFFGISLPDLDLDIEVEVSIAIQQDVLGIMLKGKFFGLSPTPLTCVFKYENSSLSCKSAFDILFTIIKDGIMWVVQKAKIFFEQIGNEIRGAINDAGEWIAKDILTPMIRLFNGQCTCPANKEQSGLLCYDKCRENFYGIANRCLPNCPRGFRNDGDFCYKPDSYGRGVGYAIWDEGKCNSQNKQGCEKNLLMYYPKCQENFHNVGCCTCSPDCPSNMNDIGISCHKSEMYYRDIGSPLDCSQNHNNNSASSNDPDLNNKKSILEILLQQQAQQLSTLEREMQYNVKSLSDHLKKMREKIFKRYDEELIKNQERNSKKMAGMLANKQNEEEKMKIKKQFSEVDIINNLRISEEKKKLDALQEAVRKEFQNKIFSRIQTMKYEHYDKIESLKKSWGIKFD